MFRNRLFLVVLCLISLTFTSSCALLSKKNHQLRRDGRCSQLSMEVHVSSDLDNPKSLEMALEYLRLVGQEVCSVDLETVSLACSVCERWTSLPRTPTLTIGEHAIPIGKDLRKDVQKWKEMARIIKKNQLPPMGLKP